MNHLQIFFVVVYVLDVRLVEGQEPTPTGVRFVGVGYNIVDGNPEGGEGNNGGVDPGLLSTRQILSLTYNDERSTNGFLVPDEVTFSPRQSCVKESSHSTFFGTKSYQKSLSVSVDVSGYKSVKEGTEKEHKVYHQETEVCNLGRARYREGLASKFSTTDEFASSSCELSSVYNESQYMDFLDDWGTHVVVEVDVGHKVIHRSETSRSELVKDAMRNVKNKVDVSANVWGFSASVGVDVDYLNSKKNSRDNFGNSTYTFRIGDDDLQEPVHIKIIPIVDMFKPKYWASLPTFVQKGICSDNVSVNKIRANIYRALNAYHIWKELDPAEDPNLAIPISWPRGTYGLPKPIFGCPEQSWSTGFRMHRKHSSYLGYGSDPLHFDVETGRYGSSWHLTQKFCMKTVNEQVIDDWEFQEGHYCIYRKGTQCPTGFADGYVVWGDYGNFLLSESISGSVPDGFYDTNTKIYFCCRSDGFYENPILLPTERPFMLFANAFECQQVRGMNVTKESYTFKTLNSNVVQGSVPISRKGSSYLTFYYCYYESNQHV